jgi:hypothetical protein
MCVIAAANPAKVIAVPKHEHTTVLSAASDAYFTHSAHLKEPDDKLSASIKEDAGNTAQHSVDVKFANAETNRANASMAVTGQPFGVTEKLREIVWEPGGYSRRCEMS